MTDKTLNQYALGETIAKEDSERYFGKEFMEIFTGDLKLVAVTFTVQDQDGVQMDYKLKHKDYLDEEAKDD